MFSKQRILISTCNVHSNLQMFSTDNPGGLNSKLVDSALCMVLSWKVTISLSTCTCTNFVRIWQALPPFPPPPPPTGKNCDVYICSLLFCRMIVTLTGQAVFDSLQTLKIQSLSLVAGTDWSR